MDSEGRNLPFMRNLASSDRKVRTAALTSLTTFLTSRRPPKNTLTETDALKLWAGLFYAMWMCDRPVPQQNLAAELAALLTSAVDPSCAGAWLRAFWATMARQWTGIDVLRMDKFLLLVRRVVGLSFVWARERRKLDPAAVDDVLAVLREWPLDPEGDLIRVPLGMRLHVLDLWVDELETAGYLDDERPAAVQMVRRLGDLVQAQTSKFPSKQVRKRATDSYADERLPWADKGDDGEEGQNQDENANYDDTWEGIQD